MTSLFEEFDSVIRDNSTWLGQIAEKIAHFSKVTNNKPVGLLLLGNFIEHFKREPKLAIHNRIDFMGVDGADGTPYPILVISTVRRCTESEKQSTTPDTNKIYGSLALRGYDESKDHLEEQASVLRVSALAMRAVVPEIQQPINDEKADFDLVGWDEFRSDDERKPNAMMVLGSYVGKQYPHMRFKTDTIEKPFQYFIKALQSYDFEAAFFTARKETLPNGKEAVLYSICFQNSKDKMRLAVGFRCEPLLEDDEYICKPADGVTH